MNARPQSEYTGHAPRTIRTALLWQSGAGLFGMLVAWLWLDVRIALGVGFGVLIVMASSVLLQRRIGDAAAADPEHGQRMLYAGAVMRFVLVLLALLLAYGVGLHLLAVAAGMLLAQVAMFVFAAGSLKNQMMHKGKRAD